MIPKGFLLLQQLLARPLHYSTLSRASHISFAQTIVSCAILHRPYRTPAERFSHSHCKVVASAVSEMPESRSRAPLVWIDCEMTGLDYENDTIMSLACFITDAQLNLLDETGFEVVVHHTKAELDRMGEWCSNQHGSSGLTQACLDSSVSAEEASEQLLAYVQKYCPDRKVALLAGNTVHADRAFLRRQPWTPLTKHLHHRILDVSSIKEAMRRWAPDKALKGSPMKRGLHEAKSDILESIAEARYYKEVFFVDPKLDGP